MGNMDETSALSVVDAANAIPRVYNFADDILRRNLAAGRADKPVFIDPRGSWTYGEVPSASYASDMCCAISVLREKTGF